MSVTPNGYTEDQTPSFEFQSSEPGVLSCRITSDSSSPSFQPCASPFVPAAPLPRDVFYTFEVKAVDAAGNVDSTPAAWEFNVETPITKDQQTAELVAALLLPDAETRDVPALCGEDAAIDCPGGSPAPPDDDQLSTSSTRSVVSAGPNTDSYNVTVTHGAQTLSPAVISRSGTDCNLGLNSTSGTSPHWTIFLQLSFGSEPQFVPGGTYISSLPLSVTGIERADWVIGGSFICASTDFLATTDVAEIYPFMADANTLRLS